jgi:hypothetical protein
LRAGGRLGAAGVEVTSDKPVSFGSPERVGEDFVGDAVEGVVEVLAAAIPDR